MKQRLLLLLIALAALLPSRASAQTFTYEHEGKTLSYSVSDESAKTVTVFGAEIKGDVIIPEKVSYEDTEYTVSSIKAEAFIYCTAITSIAIPNTVTSIGEKAFYQCTSLSSIEIPNSVTEIGGAAFQLCISLKAIAIPNSITRISYSTFQECAALKSIDIPNSVTRIDDSGSADF